MEKLIRSISRWPRPTFRTLKFVCLTCALPVVTAGCFSQSLNTSALNLSGALSGGGGKPSLPQIPVTPVSSPAPGQLSPSVMSLGIMGALNGFIPSPSDAWHQTIASSPVDPNSANILSGIGAGHLHHDFWSTQGIPYIVVDSLTTPLIPWTNNNGNDPQSDQTLFPLLPNLPLEGAPPACGGNTGDNHAIVLDRHTGVGYEMWATQYCPNVTPSFSAMNGTIFDFTTTTERPYTYTSADAAGLSVFEGLVRYDEILAGVIPHAIRFTTAFTRCGSYHNGDGQGSFILPATHSACNNSGSLNIYGMRLRLRSDFDISGFSPANRIILTAMKQYGLLLADLGSNLYFQGTPDPRWNDNDLNNLDSVPKSAFEVVQMPAPYTSDSYPTGTAPVIHSFTASSTSISAGQAVTLTANVTGASYNYIDHAGFLRGNSITVTPTSTTTYTLTSSNYFLQNDDGFGDGTRPTASVTITVH